MLCLTALAAAAGPARGAIDVPGEVPTIAGALALAAPGDTVRVAPGVYSTTTGETFPLMVPPGVALVAPGGPEKTVLVAVAALDGPMLRMPSGGTPARVEGFAIEGTHLALVGIQVEGASPAVTRCAVTGFTRGGGAGCRVLGASSPAVTACTFGGNVRGLELLGGTTGPLVERNIFVASDSAGLFCELAVSSPMIRCNLFFANQLHVRGLNATCLIAPFNGTNLLLDPMVCDREEGDYRLSEASPGIPGGAAPACTSLGAFGIGCARPAPLLTSATPSRLYRPASTALTVRGLYLGPWTSARLEGPSGGAIPGLLESVSPDSAIVRFELASAPKGDWDVVLADPEGRDDRIAAAVRIVRGEVIRVPEEIETIAKGLEVAFDGDTVRVRAGVVGAETTGPLPIRLRRGIVLAGEGAESTVIAAEGAALPPAAARTALVVALGPSAGGDADSTTIVRDLTLDGLGRTAWGVFVRGCDPRVRDCLIRNFRAPAGAAAISAVSGSPRVERCTLARSDAGLRAVDGAAPRLTANLFALDDAGVVCEGAAPQFACNDFWGNEGADVSGVPSPIGAAGNAALDPQFCDRLADDLRLAASSPCAPAGSGGCGQIGAFGVGCDAADPSRRILVPEERGTVTEALAVTSAGDTVWIAPGVHGAGETYPLRLRRGRVLYGPAGAAATRLAAPPLAAPAEMVRFDGDSLTVISHLTLDGGGATDLLVRADSARGERIEHCALVAARGNAVSSAAVKLGSGPLRISRSVLHANTNGVTVVGAGLLTIDRSIVASSGRYGLLCAGAGSEVVATCNDVWGSGGADYAEGCADLLGRQGNVSVDPLFCDAASGDLRLRADSPLLPLCEETLLIGPFEETCLPRTPDREEGEDGPSERKPEAAPERTARSEEAAERSGDTGTGESEAVPPPGRAGAAAPERFALEGPFPNPVRADGRAAIRLSLPQAAEVRIRLVAPSGRALSTLLERALPAGRHDLPIELGGPDGLDLPPGVYILIMEAGREHAARRLLIAR